MNQFNLIINGTNVTPYCPFPPKTETLLDERLDMARVDLIGYPGNVFPYMSDVSITFTDYTGATQTEYYLIATDTAEETAVGSGLYNHKIELIEETKYLECFLVDTQTYTNDLGRNYTENAPLAIPVTTGSGVPFVEEAGGLNSVEQFTSSILPGSLTIPASGDLTEGKKVVGQDLVYTATATVFKNGVQITTGQENTAFTITAEIGYYEIEYEGSVSYDISGVQYGFNATYYIEVINNTAPLPVWNIASVINRLLTIAEPLRRGDTPRFSLDETLQEQLEAIEAPEFTFTTDTLREALNQVGGFIHAMPRLKRLYDSTGETFQYIVTFDFYGSMELSNAASYPYVEDTYGQDIESYATKLDSQVDNLVNSMQDGSGTITEPYCDGYKTVRTETAYARISDSGMIIETQFPIYDVISLTAGILPNQTYSGGDLTPYVFESADYSRMSSVGSTYPNSKMYAIYFVQGEKNIMGLDFKRPNAVTPANENYAIINILRQTSGDSNFSLSGDTDYPQLAFQLVYRPIWNARIQQTKSNISGILKPRALAYNQSANLIESRYYGENLKGAIARIGNVGGSRTFIGRKLASIPKVGQLFDEDYYIAGVSVEWGVFDYKCSLALSKDFNRLSQYIGIDAQKRYYEVSEKAAYNRNINFTDYLVIGDSIGEAEYTYFNNAAGRLALTNTFRDGFGERVTYVIAQGFSSEEAAEPDLPEILLPVIACAFGNSMVFSFSYADNYSAGNQAVYAEAASDDDVSGYFQQGTAYADTYGRMEYLQWEMCGNKNAPFGTNAQEEQTDIGTALPLVSSEFGFADAFLKTKPDGTGTNDYAMLVKKDSREKISVNYQIEFVTNRKNMVIGSGFAKTCPLVFNRSSGGAQLWILPNKINKFAQTIDTTGGINLGYVTPTSQNGILTFPATTATADGEAWAFLDSEVKEEGSTIRELIFGENTAVTSGEAIDLPVMTPKHNLF